MRQHGAKSGALSLHFSNTHKYTEMAAETMDHEPEPVDPLLAPAPHQMPSHHSTAFLGDFRLLRAIFGKNHVIYGMLVSVLSTSLSPQEILGS